jgi:DNA-binding NarL/FixJ family response regulator
LRSILKKKIRVCAWYAGVTVSVVNLKCSSMEEQGRGLPALETELRCREVSRAIRTQDTEQNISLSFPMKETAKTIKVIIADDQNLFLDGLKMLVADYKSIRITGEASNGEEVLELVVKAKPDVIITGIHMAVMDGIKLTRELEKYYPEIKIIALTGLEEDHYVVDMLEAGAKAFLTKHANKEKLVEAIYAVLGNANYFCERTSMKLLRKIAGSKIKVEVTENASILTATEQQVVLLICEELSNKEIAGRLNIGT